MVTKYNIIINIKIELILKLKLKLKFNIIFIKNKMTSQEEVDIFSIIVIITSKIATHNALIDLGRQQEINNIKLEKRNEKRNRYKNIVEGKEILNSLVYFNSINKITDTKKYMDNVLNFCHQTSIYVSYVNKYLCLLEEDIKNLQEKNDKLKKENKELLEENKEKIKENDNLTRYWSNRIQKLREKCIYKNRKIKYSYLMFIFIISQMLAINYIGIINYINLWYFILYGVYYSINIIINYSKKIFVSFIYLYLNISYNIYYMIINSANYIYNYIYNINYNNINYNDYNIIIIIILIIIIL